MTDRMTTRVADLLPTRYSLLSRLENRDDHDSWKEFFDIYWQLIYSFARKSGLTETEAQDVVQETIISVARDIHKFKRDRSRGSFKGWLRNLTRWRIADQLRRRTEAVVRGPSPGRETTQEFSEPVDPASADVDAVWEEDWRENLFAAAVERVKSKVREEHFQAFDLNVLRHWPASAVAETLDLNIGQVYLAKHRIMGLIRKEIRELEKRW